MVALLRGWDGARAQVVDGCPSVAPTASTASLDSGCPLPAPPNQLCSCASVTPFLGGTGAPIAAGCGDTSPWGCTGSWEGAAVLALPTGASPCPEWGMGMLRGLATWLTRWASQNLPRRPASTHHPTAQSTWGTDPVPHP